nr:hypothetical protein [Zymomonas mobilis]
MIPNKKTLIAMTDARASKLKKFDSTQSLMDGLHAEWSEFHTVYSCIEWMLAFIEKRLSYSDSYLK